MHSSSSLKRFLVATCSLAVVAAAMTACSSGSSNSSNSGDGGTTDKGNGNGSACSLSPGEYTTHYTADQGNNANCPPQSDTTFTITDDAGTSSGGDEDAGFTCTTDEDQAACSATTKCTNSSMTITNSQKLDGNSSVSGTLEYELTGSISMKCKYTYTTKKK